MTAALNEHWCGCPFCGCDPYEFVDIGVGHQPVAVTCCELGVMLFDGRGRTEAETAFITEAATNARALRQQGVDFSNRLAAADDALTASEARIAKLRKALDAGATLLDDLDALIGDSGGVYGLHLNGDNAPWDSLTAGGRFEEWLMSIETFRAALQKASPHD